MSLSSIARLAGAAALAVWFCPEGCDAPFQRFDPRVGGSYRVCLRGRESGTEWWMQGEFLEIQPNERIVFTHVWDDVARRPDKDSVVTVTFSDTGDGTRMHFHQQRFVSEAERDDHRGGWNSCLNRLEALLAADAQARRLTEQAIAGHRSRA